MGPQLTLGPVLFNWSPDTWRDFYLQIADEAPVDIVFVGEVVCSKRAPLFEPHLAEVVTRLESAGKQVVLATLAQVSSRIDRKLVEVVASASDIHIEVNDASALWHLRGRAHAIGPYMNIYNEASLDFVASKGARSVCLPPETPAPVVRAMGGKAREIGVELEFQVYGRIPLALSARCYHARAHGRTKDSCQFICEEDPDGLELRTVENQPFLAINGIQTMSHTVLNLVDELEGLASNGISRFRISPQSRGMVEVIEIFSAALGGELSAEDATARLKDLSGGLPLSNGFYHGLPGYLWVDQGDAAFGRHPE